jgi:hypothetical protein
MKSWRWICGAFTSLLIVLPASAQDPQDDWQGSLKVPNAGQLRLVFHSEEGRHPLHRINGQPRSRLEWHSARVNYNRRHVSGV